MGKGHLGFIHTWAFWNRRQNWSIWPIIPESGQNAGHDRNVTTSQRHPNRSAILQWLPRDQSSSNCGKLQCAKLSPKRSSCSLLSNKLCGLQCHRDCSVIAPRLHRDWGVTKKHWHRKHIPYFVAILESRADARVWMEPNGFLWDLQFSYLEWAGSTPGVVLFGVKKGTDFTVECSDKMIRTSHTYTKIPFIKHLGT